MTAPAIRPPKPTLAGIKTLAAELARLETDAAATRERLTIAVVRAHRAEIASQSEIARAAGVSRQRVGQLIRGE